jgi:acyl-coenzyme A synthetase/AMP-(fatty) acid ligase
MTEVLPVTDIDAAGIQAAGAGDGVCVGVPLPSVTVGVSELSDAGVADGPPLGKPHVTGEVCVSAPHVKDRYDSLWVTQRASARDEGWHHTGDVGHLDEQGRLWIEGRLEHVIATAAGVVTPVGIEQRVESLDEVRAAAAVGVGPAGTAQVVVVVVPRDRPAKLIRSPVASLELTDSVRRSAGVDVAAVLVASDLPVDIRHNSKVNRRKVAAWAAGVLAGKSRTAPIW